ncbi:MAG: DUF2889 domain-containing protein [Burkholderiaceae bacterium]|jgi:hypothetical protein
MPLPPPDPDRTPLHHRAIEVRGWRRRDGMFEVEATLTDTKAEPAPWVRADGVLHHMQVRLVFDESMTVRDVVACTDASPYPVCPDAAPGLAVLKGLSMASGWSRTVRERLGGVKGCTHLVELLGPMATTAFQTLAPLRMAAPDVLDASGRPRKIDSCQAYAAQGELVRVRWPEHHVAPPDGRAAP